MSCIISVRRLMNDLSNFEALEVLSIFESSMDVQLQLWLTMTFAAIAASFMAGERLTRTFAHFMAAIYLLATIGLAARWMVELSRITTLIQEYDVIAQAIPSWGIVVAVPSFLMFILGTGGCVFCIYYFRARPT